VSGDLGVFAYRSNGARDRTFGRRGFFLKDPWLTRGAEWDVPSAVIRHGRNATVVAGGILSQLDYLPYTESTEQTLTRVFDSGRIDSRFGNSGTVRIPKLTRAVDVGTASRGRIVTLAGREIRGGGLLGTPLTTPNVTVSRFSAKGRVDRSFGRDGTFTYSPRVGSVPMALTLDDRNRVLVAAQDVVGDNPRGRLRESRLLRLNADGTRDRSFGRNGLAEPPPFEWFITDVVSLPGGDLVAAGYRKGRERSVYLRYKANGRLNDEYGESGVLTAGKGSVRHLTPLRDGRLAATLEKGIQVVYRFWESVLFHEGVLGPITTGRMGSVISAPSANATPLLARIKADGNIDTAFESRGLPQLPIKLPRSAHYTEIDAMRGGDLVSTTAVSRPNFLYELTLRRVTSDGRPRRGFGNSGVLRIDEPRFRSLWFTIPGRGETTRILGAGNFGDTSFRVEVGKRGRYRPFRLEGIPQGGVLDALTLPSGSMLVASSRTKKVKTKQGRTNYRYGFTVARFLRGGALDRSFGKRGLRSIFLRRSAVPSSIATDSRGRIVVAGGYCTYYATCGANKSVTQAATFVRLTPSGDLDRSFGEGGSIEHTLGLEAAAEEVVVLRDGRIVAKIDRVCESCPDTEVFMGLRRDGSLDRRFGRGGKLFLSLGREFQAAKLFPAGRHGVDLAASLETCRRNPQFAVVRLNRRGSRDRRFGGGDGLVDALPRRFVDADVFDAARRGKDSMVLSGSARVFGRYGNPEEAAALVALRLWADDGITNVRTCRDR
jgi:uncharacterized delta-60 repeat protein